MTSRRSFWVYDDNTGKPVQCQILFCFAANDTGKQYVVYTDNTMSGGSVNTYASRYEGDLHGASMELLPIESEEEWRILNFILSSIQQAIKEGIPRNKMAAYIDSRMNELQSAQLEENP